MAEVDFHGQCALVTGAGSGIGRSTALAFAEAGADVILCDISGEGLARTAADARALGRRVLSERVDVSDREQMRAFAERVHSDREAVDVLVNNAGVALAGGFLETTLEDWEWILSINLWGVIHGCHFFLPRMVKRARGGHVVNISSAAGFYALSSLNAYSTTKFGVFGLSEALREELVRHRIGVTTVCPGMINTPIIETAQYRGIAATAGARGQAKELMRKWGTSPDHAAKCILDAVRNNTSVLPITGGAWALYAMKRAAPGLTAAIGRAIEKKMQQKIT